MSCPFPNEKDCNKCRAECSWKKYKKEHVNDPRFISLDKIPSSKKLWNLFRKKVKNDKTNAL